ncbi:hypothetical protein [Corynebacterium sp. UBA2622]|uniref:hypothetical protein n=1 Tax=Corynebacterium sp. UBA2622 TaxID=1946393 RepID=UPI0025BAE339|nr:hypothetical protein [Corynebacterium sp. UBA2622]
MGLLDRLRALLGGTPATPLVDYPDEFRQAGVGALHVHTANLSPDTDEKMVVLTLPESALTRLADLGTPLRLTAPEGRAVTFVPVDARANPALDPNLGWIIPVTAETAAELAALPAGPGAHELHSLHLGVIVESA